MAEFCTYLYRDPKTFVWRYVGKGMVGVRPHKHFYLNTRLGRMLRKRQLEGFNIQPVILMASSEGDALEMEQLLISMLGREDLGTGTLFNFTDGGEKGTTGRKASIEEKVKRLTTMQAKSPEEQMAIKLKIQQGRAKFIAANPDKRKEWNRKTALAKSKPCTVDGITIYGSREELIAALGQGKAGRRSPTFRYV